MNIKSTISTIMIALSLCLSAAAQTYIKGRSYTLVDVKLRTAIVGGTMNNLKFMDQVVFTSDRGTKLVGYCEQTDSYTIVDVTVSGSVGVVPHIETTKKDEKRVLGCGFLLAYVGETRGGMIEEEIKTAEAVTKSIKEGHAAVPDTLFFQRTDDGNMGVCLTISSEGHPHITETVVTILEEKKLSQ